MTKHPIEVITSVERRAGVVSRKTKSGSLRPALSQVRCFRRLPVRPGIHVSQLFRLAQGLCRIEEPRTDTASTLVASDRIEAAPPASPHYPGARRPVTGVRRRCAM